MIKPIDNKGFTLVELLISMAISVIVIASIAYFMSYSSKNYRSANDEVILQTESQTILNQLNDLIIEASNVKFDDATDKLYIYKKDANEEYIISFDSVNHRLMFEKTTYKGIESLTNQKMFGQYVELFHIIDTGTSDSNKKIEISIDFKKGNKTYSIQKSIVTIRNGIKSVTKLKNYELNGSVALYDLKPKRKVAAI